MRKIVIGVVVCHLIFLMVLCYTTTPPDLIVPKRFAVKTVSLKAEKELSVAQVAAGADPVVAAQPVVKAPVVKAPAPAVAKKTAPAKKVEKKTVTTSAPSAKSDAIAKARKALSNLNKVTPTTTTTTPTAIETLSIEGLEGDSYISEIVVKLQKGLKLPEFGEVTVELTLEKSGKVLDLVVKDAKSLSNKMYVEKTLPSLKFPIFEGSLKHENNHTFIFVLNSAMD